MTVPVASPRVLAIATVLPPQVCTREQSVAIAGQVFHDQPEALAFIERLLMASGIEKRHTVIADYGRPMENPMPRCAFYLVRCYPWKHDHDDSQSSHRKGYLRPYRGPR